MSGAVLDTGALIGFDNNKRQIALIVNQALANCDPLLIPAGVVAQAWRDGRTQARLARLLGASTCEIIPLDDQLARSAGQLCGATGTADVVDASVALIARKRGLRVLTSDPDDILGLDNRIDVVVV